MSVVAVWETHDGREGDLTIDSGTLRRVFWVQTDNAHDGPLVARDAPGVPQLYSVYFDGYAVNLNYVVNRKSATNADGSQKLWKVEVEYEAKLNPNDDERNPTLKPAVYAWSTGTASVPMLVDVRSQKVENAVQQPFDPAVERNIAFSILTITRNEASYDDSAMAAYRNTLNSTPIFGYGAREGYMDSINATSEYDQEFGAYWSVTYTIHFRDSSTWAPTIASNRRLRISGGTISTGADAPGSWDITQRNIGTRYKKAAADTTTVVAVDAQGNQEPDPVDLKDDGTRVYEDSYWWIFYPYANKSWTPLHLEP